MKRPLLLSGTFLVICIVYTFTFFSWIGLESISHLLQRWSHQSEMTIFLRPEVKTSQIEELAGILDKYSDKTKHSFQSSDDIKKNISKLFPRGGKDLAKNDELIAIIPPHFIVLGSSNLSGSSLFNLFDKITRDIKPLSYIESSSYGKSWMDKYSMAFSSFQNGTIIFLLALSMAVILAIGNTIRSHIHSRRDEIEILELVGATTMMIRKPFLIEGAILSVSAMMVALCIGSTSVYFLRSNTFESIQFLDLMNSLHQPDSVEWLISFFLALIVGFLGSYICLTEINTGWAASEQGHHA